MNDVAYRRMIKELDKIGNLEDTNKAKQEINERIDMIEKIISSGFHKIFKSKGQEQIQDLLKYAKRIRFEILMKEN